MITSRKKLLFAWIGMTDLRVQAGEEPSGGLGPIAGALSLRHYDGTHLLYNQSDESADSYKAWLSVRFPQVKPIGLERCPLSSPVDYREIYLSAKAILERMRERLPEAEFEFHLSSGTPAMAAVWILLAKTIFPAVLIDSSQREGTTSVREVDIPFDISAEFMPSLLKKADEDIQGLMSGLPPESPEFTKIIQKCEGMKRAVGMARKLSMHEDIPVLISGESGTGKELFARAIHASSPRAKRPFVAVNCGAIPENLFESELFGHVRGAFTGADKDKDGFMLAAEGGTLFLDEIGELPKTAQVKLLRALQEKSIYKVGSTKALTIDIRIISATNRDLIEEVVSGVFREDLFHRVAIGLLKIPPLRERHGDIGLIIDSVLARINGIRRGQSPAWKDKKCAPGARTILLSHKWPGNFRELENTMTRAVIWSSSDIISEADVRSAMLDFPMNRKTAPTMKKIGEGVDLQAKISELAVNYIEQALKESNGNKSRAAEMLGLSNYQTLDNWRTKYASHLRSMQSH
ncbi:MAG: sigma 54-interacting transcriptional regulator [Victivallales bacterium]|nr:sigma 54-interacting transcriptional regulator [Victivallales bacterium]